MATPEAFAPVAITRRSGCDESVHFGAVVGLSSSGEVEFAVGDPGTALVCASHDGTTKHLEAVRRILATAGLTEASLANTPGLPLDEAAAEAVFRNGGGRTPLQMNCSGKHSGMLVTSALNGWPIDATYLETDHPLQQAITATIDDVAGEPHSHIGVDGCGSPAHVISLLGLARAFRAIAVGDAGIAGNSVYECMTMHPDMVGGDDRDVTKFMRNVPGLMAKDGADGVFAAALPDGRAVALKIADGGNRARPPVMLAALRALGVDTSAVEPLVVESILLYTVARWRLGFHVFIVGDRKD